MYIRYAITDYDSYWFAFLYGIHTALPTPLERHFPHAKNHCLSVYYMVIMYTCITLKALHHIKQNRVGFLCFELLPTQGKAAYPGKGGVFGYVLPARVYRCGYCGLQNPQSIKNRPSL